MFLDYDGTLSPIVDDPDKAFMTAEVCLLFYQLSLNLTNEVLIKISYSIRLIPCLVYGK